MTDMFANATPNFSFEIFPPKGAGRLSSIFETVDALASLHPDLISVTYGAGGSSRDNTIEIASTIQRRYMLPAVAHLTCVGSTLEQTDALLRELKEKRADAFNYPLFLGIVYVLASVVVVYGFLERSA